MKDSPAPTKRRRYDAAFQAEAQRLAARCAPDEVLARMKTRYELRLDRLCNRAAGILASQLADKPLTQFQELQEAVIYFERATIEELRQAEQTREEALHKLENEFDLEEARLALDRL